MNLNVVKVEEILRKVEETKIALYGDFCLDVYWPLDARGSEISVETGIHAQAVVRQKYSLGGASNVAANLAALTPKQIKIVGVVGNDIFGREMISQLQYLGIDTTGLVVQNENFETYTYIKRILSGEEQPRIDFGYYNERTLKTDSKVLANLEYSAKDADVIIINQQIHNSINNKEFFDGLNDIIHNLPEKIFIVDSRHFAAKFKNVCLKINEIEAANLCEINTIKGDVFNTNDVEIFAKQLYNKHNKPVFVSRGGYGIIACDKNGLHQVPGLQFLKKLDTVGAGDTALSALSCSLAAKISTQEAIEIANFASGVTVQKLFQTGTASPKEIIAISKEPNYIFQPELANNLRLANYFNNSDIEICCDINTFKNCTIKHAVFDHDGTISVLREGWESVMEPMMIKAILGDTYQIADEHLFNRVKTRVRDYIDKSTGIQTVVQMEGLIDLVDEFNIIPIEKILDKFGYKEIYNNDLMEMVKARVKKLNNKELDVNDFAVKGSIEFLQSLYEIGIKLYLASGTDNEDVIAEAKAMGYANLFEDRIYGAIGDVSKYSKKMVLEKIIKENNLSGSELITIGDGPVEMRECRRVNGIALGIASDEVRRHGLNIEKRNRLIKSGAQIIVPDFSQRKYLSKILFNSQNNKLNRTENV